MLRQMRIRQEAVEQMSDFNESTTEDLFPRLLRARQYIEANYREDFSNREVSRLVNLSEFHFTRLFKTAFGISPGQLHKRVRLTAARKMILYSTESITDISFEVGYESLSSFTNAFRTLFGKSPRELRTGNSA
jgi:AraC family transcriptional regulator